MNNQKNLNFKIIQMFIGLNGIMKKVDQGNRGNRGNRENRGSLGNRIKVVFNLNIII
jgi:hypothetical protein